jgi:hypothetical protein
MFKGPKLAKISPGTVIGTVAHKKRMKKFAIARRFNMGISGGLRTAKRISASTKQAQAIPMFCTKEKQTAAPVAASKSVLGSSLQNGDGF